jgi:hypothetical protein
MAVGAVAQCSIDFLWVQHDQRRLAGCLSVSIVDYKRDEYKTENEELLLQD